MNSQPNAHTPPVSPFESAGAGDHDEPYRFGRRPNARAPYPFTDRQFARLLIMRGRVRDDLNCAGCDGEWAA
jgi:hypothetical protein